VDFEQWINLRKDFLAGGLQHIDLVRHLVLTGSELVHGLPQPARLSWRAAS
jgi:hypothetical protein